ncbi:MAG: phosphoribosylglycinamide synthetase, partial [Thermoleophilaceae bacterium]|nr:phosphoribosylglycinamide synthetase [Thermoleophilaceae bacterium]
MSSPAIVHDSIPAWAASSTFARAASVAPCVVKPRSLSASRGVIRADDPRAAAAAVARVRAILAEAGEDPEGPLLIERYVP